MKNIRIVGFYILGLFGIFNLSHGQDGEGEQTTVRMGAARVNITPGVPVPMTGYASRTEPFTGVHDSLFATALYFMSPDNSLLLITADLIGYSREFIEETQEMIAARIGIAPEIKNQSPFSNTVIMTHCNGSSGYICTDKAFTEGGYEIKVTRLMPGAEVALSSELLQMINNL